MANMINLVIRVMPSGDELDVELPVFSTGREIVQELLDANVAPRTDSDGNPQVYELVSKASNVKIEDNKTLHDLQVRDGEILYFIPKLVAG